MTLQLTDNAFTVLQTRYLIGEETPEELLRRVARAVAEAEAPADQARWEETFYQMMAALEFLPNSPTLFNAGTGQGTLSACFVIPVEDTMESIMQAATTSAMIQKFGGGLGYTFSKLRPQGSPIATTQGKACGAVAVLTMFSALSDMITQGGKRHGANMGILHVSHPEIMDFIRMKEDNVTAQNFNISVAVTDAFMETVEKDGDWDLIGPHTGQVVETVRARHIWGEIVQSAWSTGDPGLYFIDEANRSNPTPHLGSLDSTNPCGEVPLLAHEACNLGSINLGLFIRRASPSAEPSFDFAALEELTRKATRFLDDVVTINQFPAQEVADAVAKTRKTGLGVMGWHDALIQMGIPYDSPEALDLADRVMGAINRVAGEVSLELAQERGAYPAHSEVCTAQNQEPLSSALCPLHYRNATRTCIAPTGSISAIAGASSGIEPIFALAYVKNVLDGQRLREINPYFVQIARQRGFFSQELMEEVTRTGSCQHLDQVPENVKALFKTALEIDDRTHVQMQATFQRHTNLAVSKTINLPNTATPQNVAHSYWMAYESHCTGITVYRDGSKPVQVLQVSKAEDTEQTAEGVRLPRERPAHMRGVTERIRTGHGNIYITINFDEKHQPFEVFTTLGKAGSCEAAQLEAISRLVSLSLRSSVPASAVVEQLQGITCDPAWDQGVLVRSAPDAVALALKRHALPQGSGASALQESYGAQLGLPMALKGNGNGNGSGGRHLCPECGGPAVFQEGCMVCPACGWNLCGG